MRITVIGAGYVGLVTGVCLAANKHEVICVESQPSRLQKLRAGTCPFFEPGLSELLKETIASGRFAVAETLREAVLSSELTFIAVGTPTTDQGTDFSALDAVVGDLGAILREHPAYHTVVVKSTVLPMTTDTRVRRKIENASGRTLGEFGLGMNPEFLREGQAIEDFLNPDRIVIGAADDQSFETIRQVYAFTDAPIFRTNPRTAELIKYATNSLLATLISFSNEIAGLCETLEDVDVVQVLEGLHMDRRLTPSVGDQIVRPGILAYLKPGCGFGGSCLPKDVSALSKFGDTRQYPMPILSGVLQVNAEQPLHLAHLAEDILEGLNGKEIAVLGLSFKPDTDDIRESPSIPIVRYLVERGARVRAHDPVAMPNAQAGPLSSLPIFYGASMDETLRGADAAIITVGWPMYRKLTPTTLKALLRQPILIDGRRVFSATEMMWGGIRYYGTGYSRVNNHVV